MSYTFAPIVGRISRPSMLRAALQEVFVHRRAVDDHARFQPRSLTCLASAAVLPSESRLDDHQLARFHLWRTERGSGPVCGTSWSGRGRGTHDRTFVNATPAEDRSRTCTVACAAGAFLAIDLLCGIVHFGACLYLVRAGLGVVALPADHTVQDVCAWLKTKQGLVQSTDPALPPSSLITSSFMLHHLPQALLSPELQCSCRFQSGRERHASGSFFFTASLTVTQPPLEPGTAPLIMIRPRSASVLTTSRFCVVTRAAPM